MTFYQSSHIFINGRFVSGGVNVVNGLFIDGSEGKGASHNAPEKGDLGGAYVIPGLVDIHVHTEPLRSSNCDLMLKSLFISEYALHIYSNHPSHVLVANTKVRPFTATRTCMDFVI